MQFYLFSLRFYAYNLIFYERIFKFVLCQRKNALTYTYIIYLYTFIKNCSMTFLMFGEVLNLVSLLISSKNVYPAHDFMKISTDNDIFKNKFIIKI